MLTHVRQFFEFCANVMDDQTIIFVKCSDAESYFVRLVARERQFWLTTKVWIKGYQMPDEYDFDIPELKFKQPEEVKPFTETPSSSSPGKFKQAQEVIFSAFFPPFCALCARLSLIFSICCGVAYPRHCAQTGDVVLDA
jgi:hypothetical protein